MNYQELKQEFKKNRNVAQAKQLAGYMRNRFEFYGYQTPQRRAIYHQFLLTEKKKQTIDWGLLNQAWDDFWIRRIAIEHQLLRKQQMNTQLLEKILQNNLNSSEFFINKAIGWALRDYSKTNPAWVENFIAENKQGLSRLSIKEGSKYL